MGLKVPQSSFSAGELDPELWERTTLNKFKTGLATGRNIVVTKNGTIITRQARAYVRQTKLDDRAVLGYSPPGTGYFIEWGHLYVRVYDNDGALVGDTIHALTEDDLPSIRFETSNTYVYIFSSGNATLKLNYVTAAFSTTPFDLLAFPSVSSVSVTSTTATGYRVDYGVTYVKDGEESQMITVSNAAYLLPVAIAEHNVIDSALAATSVTGITEMRVYRRPFLGGAYGYIGSSSNFSISGGNTHASFVDLGQDADYSHGSPSLLLTPTGSPGTFLSKVGMVYQQRLLQVSPVDLEGIFASRPGFQNNYTRNYPLDDDSALRFKAGSSGYAKVLDMLDSDGLVVFTSRGVFLNQGALGADNLALTRKAKNVILEGVRPLVIPGGTIFVDAATNTIRNLVWSTELNGYNAQEISIFSNHLFKTRQITSWAFQEGALPLLWVTFDDGTFASFTYDFDQEMRAWTRHDSLNITVEQVVGTDISDTTYFIVKNGTTRYIEVTIPRYVPVATLANNPEADKYAYIAYLDSMVSAQTLLNDSLTGADVFTLTPVVADTWDGLLTMTCGTSGIFTLAGPGAVGEVFRIFDSEGSSYDLEVTARASDNSITVQPNIEFDETLASGGRFYRTITQVTGLSHMEGEDVALIVDGYVVSSPNNDIDNLTPVTVDTGAITIPNNIRGAIVHVGRPVIGDIETLDIDTVEQAPTLVESKTVNKLYVKTYLSRGLYVGNSFPEDNLVDGMQSIEQFDIDYSSDNPVIANRYDAPKTKRNEISLPGDWSSNGHICLRQVDPIHAQILSIIPDVEILPRSG